MLPYSPVKIIRTFSYEDKSIAKYSSPPKTIDNKDKREKNIIIDKDTLKKKKSFSRDPFN